MQEQKNEATVELEPKADAITTYVMRANMTSFAFKYFDVLDDFHDRELRNVAGFMCNDVINTHISCNIYDIN